MARFLTATVTEVLSQRPGLQRVLVDGQPAYVLTALVGPVAAGDRVVVNTTAVDRGLGTGGWHVVHWNLSRSEWTGPAGGHVLKLRYTSLQADVGVAEESGVTGAGLQGMPVVVCDLHSQVGCVALAFARAAPGRRLVFVMTDWAALPVDLSDLVADLRAAGVLAATVSAGQAFGGDLEAVNVASALVVARERAGADAVVVGPGPGSVGTGTPLGFGSLEAVSALGWAESLGGTPVVAVRWSDADSRPRHQGLSHHTLAVLEHVGVPVVVPVPAGEGGPLAWPPPHRAMDMPVADFMVAGEPAGLPGQPWPTGLESMGRRPADDPAFFRWAAAAGVAAAQLVTGQPAGPDG